MSVVDAVANEAALRFLADETSRLELMLAQAVGNLALANKRIDELEEAAKGIPVAPPTA